MTSNTEGKGKLTSFLKKIFIYFREREHEWEGQRESQTDSTLSGEPDAGLDPMTQRTQPQQKSEVRCLTNCATQASLPIFKLSCLFVVEL